MDIDMRTYDFTQLALTQAEFDTLIFMGPPPVWEDFAEEPSHQFLLDLCYNPLTDVVLKVMEKSENCPETAATVFEGLKHIRVITEKRPWFERHLILAKNFNKQLMPRLWVRNLAKDKNRDENKAGVGSFYLEDGGHRALVYAVRVACGEEHYQPVKALHATAWDFAYGILGHKMHRSSFLENDGVFNAGPREHIKDEEAPSRLFRRE